MVDQGTGKAASKILVLKDRMYALCNSSEQFRVAEEELTDGAFDIVGYDWSRDEEEIYRRIAGRQKIGSDCGIYGTDDLTGEIQKLRYVLTKDEYVRMRENGREAAQILETAVREVQQGETERDVASRITAELVRKGYTVPVCLVGADERILRYRHPIPTDKKIKNYVLAAICAQKYGLTASITRMKSFTPVSEELRHKYHALLKIDAAYITNTLPGAECRDILRKSYEIYKDCGYEADFHLHHQGGALGYLTRDYCVNFRTIEKVNDYQAFSWNPTIAGVKLEDTFIVNGNSQEIVTHTGEWVYQKVQAENRVIERPDILFL